MLGIQTKRQNITGKYAKRLTEIISRCQKSSPNSPADPAIRKVSSSQKEHEVVWE